MKLLAIIGLLLQLIRSYAVINEFIRIKTKKEKIVLGFGSLLELALIVFFMSYIIK